MRKLPMISRAPTLLSLIKKNKGGGGGGGGRTSIRDPRVQFQKILTDLTKKNQKS